MTIHDREAEASIESQIKAKNLTAPRVTPAQIDALMHGVTVHTHVFPGTATTVAAVFLRNGFCLAVEMSGCADPKNFDAEIGARIATEKALLSARDKVWELEGYSLKKALS